MLKRAYFSFYTYLFQYFLIWKVLHMYLIIMNKILHILEHKFAKYYSSCDELIQTYSDFSHLLYKENFKCEITYKTYSHFSKPYYHDMNPLNDKF